MKKKTGDEEVWPPPAPPPPSTSIHMPLHPAYRNLNGRISQQPLPLHKPLFFFQHLLFNSVLPDKSSFLNVLSVCCQEKLFEYGKCLHALSVIVNMDTDLCLSTAILTMYGKCGSLEDAHATFEVLYRKDVIAWNALIAVYAQHGYGNQCLRLFVEMHQNCIFADKFTFASMLSACHDLQNSSTGIYVHVLLSHSGYQDEVRIGTALLDMYSKNCSLDQARKVFHEMPNRDTTSWNAMISGYTQSGHIRDGIYFFFEMFSKGMIPNRITFICLINACALGSCLTEGREVHSCLIEEGVRMDVVLGSALVSMYCKCNSLSDACRIFDTLPERNLISWNSMIAGYAGAQQVAATFHLFNAMGSEGIYPDTTTYTILLEVCTKLEILNEGEKIYDMALQNGFACDSSIASSAIKLYGLCGKLEESSRIFEMMLPKKINSYTAMLAVYANHDMLFEACNLFYTLLVSGNLPNSLTFIHLLSVCGRQAALHEGKWMHLSILMHAFDKDVPVANALIDMYGKCHSLEDAYAVFDKMVDRNSVTFTIMLSAYNNSGRAADAIQLFNLMKKKNVYLDNVAFTDILNACTSLGIFSEGQNIHARLIYQGYDSDSFVFNALMYMYVKHRRLDESQWVFEHMPFRDIVSWNIIISAYAQEKKMVEMLQCICQMLLEGVVPDELTCVNMLAGCSHPENLSTGKLIHDFIISSKLETSHAVVSTLINMYGTYGRLEEAQWLFERMSERNAVPWSAMIHAFRKEGRNVEALRLFQQMQVEGIFANAYIYVSIINACCSSKMLIHGKQLHACINDSEFSRDTIISTALISMYGKCHCLEDAYTVFSVMHESDVVLWNVMIEMHLLNENFPSALQLFNQMRQSAVIIDTGTVTIILHLAARYLALAVGKQIHVFLVHSHLISDPVACNSLLNVYACCSSIKEAEIAFHEMSIRDVASWNTMIKMYIRASHVLQALQIWEQMKLEGFIPDNITFISLLEACSGIGNIVAGNHICCIVQSKNFEITVGNALVTMYIKNGYLQKALEFFLFMPEKNEASWNAIISGYHNQGYGRIAFEVFRQMLRETIPNALTFVIILCVCATCKALMYGQIIHGMILSLRLEHEILVGNSLINMYGKAGSLSNARCVFEGMKERNVVTWNTMIMVYTIYEQDYDALHLFGRMQTAGAYLNRQIFSSMLNLCTIFGASVNGRLLHMAIIERGLESSSIITTPLLNMYGKCGIIEDACNVFKNISEKDITTWTAMVSVYGYHGRFADALLLLMQMQHEGFGVDKLIIISILSACNHAGVLVVGLNYLYEAFKTHKDIADLEHVDCVIDLLGRIGKLDEVDHVINNMPFQPTMISWTALLLACQNCEDFGTGHLAVRHMNELDVRGLHTV